LHAALRKTLGDYVKQEGSLVEPGRLRFDFAAFEPMTAEQIHAVERLVYEQVIADQQVNRHVKTLDEAKTMGALAFFGDTYGENVTVVEVPGFSMELCGGTHLRSTGQIGMFRITSEVGVAAGIRRIQALVGRAAQQQSGKDRMTLDLLADKLGASEDVLVKKVEGLTEELKRLGAKLAVLSGQLARGAAEELAAKPEEFGGVRAVVGHFPKFEGAELRLVADRVREILKERYAGFLTGGSGDSPRSGAVPSGGEGDRIRYVVFVSPDLEKTMPAGRLAKVVGTAMAGGGGGKPDLAEGGGKLEMLGAGQEAFRSALRELASPPATS
jgi:alanyl-tRNA synthetase